MSTPRPLRPLLTAVALLSTLLVTGAAAQSNWESWTDAAPSVAAVDEQLAAVRARQEALPADAGADSPTAALRTALERRSGLLDELRTTLERQEELARRVTDREALEAEAVRELSELEAGPGPEPVDATPEAVAALEARVEQLGSEVQAWRTRMTEATTRAEAASERRAALEARAREADSRADELAAVAGGEDESARTLRELRMANARLDGRAARAALSLLDGELAADDALGRLRALSLDVAEQRRVRNAEALELARVALGASSEANQAAVEEELARSEREADREQDPVARFLAEKEVATLRVQARSAALDPVNLQLGRAADDQRARLDADQQELGRLRAEVEAFGTGGRVGTRLREVFRQLEPKRHAVEIAVDPNLRETADEWRARRFDLDQKLYELGTTWRAEVDAAALAAGVGDEAREALRVQAAPLREAYRVALDEERSGLTEAITRAEHLRGLQSERLAALGELETFVHAKVFWIRDGSQLDLTALRKVPGEARDVVAFGVQAASAESLAALTSAVRDPANLVGASLLLIALPIALVLLRGFLRRRAVHLEGGERDRSPWRVALRVSAALLRTALLPGYLLVLARALPSTNLPANVGTVAAAVLGHLALYFLVRGLLRLAFGPASLASRFFGVSDDAAARAHRALRRILFVYLVLLLPWAVLRRAPFEHEVLPLIALVAFLLVAAYGAFRLFRARSPITRDILGGDVDGVERWRPVWDGVLALLVLAVPVLTAAGYSFAAVALGRSVVGTLALLVVLPWAYRATQGWLDRLQARLGVVAGGVDTGDDGHGGDSAGGPDLRTIVRGAFTLAGLLAFASLWGINQQAWSVLDELHVWRANALSAEVAEFVSVADLILGACSIVLTLWLLRHLPGIYELTLFPRMNLDAGLRYAVVTISRYGLFFVGFLVALSVIHLDLSRLGWLVAAMGVGLGFGLQEIVSNFVSGIILLDERPIRVGDLVSVGTITGRVQRINIRATTVRNFDRLEVIVPNRDLITKEVTNWTLADEMTRLIVPIGVAYGSDLDLVRSLLERVVSEQPEVLADPEPQIVFVKHGDSSLDFEVRCFLAKTADRLPLQDRLNTLINGVFAEHDIEIPFPQRDLHLRSQVMLPQPPASGPREGAGAGASDETGNGETGGGKTGSDAASGATPRASEAKA